MKKIIIVSDSLRIGGIQKALENLLNSIDYNKYHVTLFLFHFDTRYLKKVPKDVHILSGNKLLDITNMTSTEAKNKGLKTFLLRKLIALFCFIFGSNLIYSILFKFEKNRGDYDVAISFSNNGSNKSVYFGSNKFTLEKIKAKKKVTWLHVDYEKMGMNTKINNNEYKKFDTIVHVSEATKSIFEYYNPSLSSKSKVIFNIIREENIKKLANIDCPFDKNEILNIVSVCRLDSNKSPQSFIYVAKKLRTENIPFKWWLVGDGPEMLKLKYLVEKEKLEGIFNLIGYTENPYKYVGNADLFVSASFSESFGIAIAEALVLNIPVVARNYPALVELIKDGVNGIIAGQSDDSLFKAVKEILSNKDLYKSIKNNASLLFSNSNIMKKIEREVFR